MNIDTETQNHEISDWSNEDNIHYYESIPIDFFRNYATIGGFEDGYDIDLIEDYILQAKSILDFGSAYGRVLKNILRRGYKGKLCAVERSKNFCSHLKREFRNKVEIIQIDIRKFNPGKKFDLILGLWSTISDFPKEEQSLLIAHLSSFLKRNGTIILDTISHTLAPLNVRQIDQSQSYIGKIEYGTIYGYTPSPREIDEYAKPLGFKSVLHVNYETPTHRRRVLHILMNKI